MVLEEDGAATPREQSIGHQHSPVFSCHPRIPPAPTEETCGIPSFSSRSCKAAMQLVKQLGGGGG